MVQAAAISRAWAITSTSIRRGPSAPLKGFAWSSWPAYLAGPSKRPAGSRGQSFNVAFFRISCRYFLAFRYFCKRSRARPIARQHPERVPICSWPLIQSSLTVVSACTISASSPFRSSPLRAFHNSSSSIFKKLSPTLSKTPARFPQGPHKGSPIPVIAHDCLPAVPARHHVIHRPFKLNSIRTCLSIPASSVPPVIMSILNG